MKPNITSLDALCQRQLDGLRACIGADGCLHDPLDARDSPVDHYGHCSLALALVLNNAPGDPALAQALLTHWQAHPPDDRGHHPFNHLLLQLAGQHLAHRGNADPAPLIALLARGPSLCPLRQDYPSNNWGLLAQACRVLAHLDTSPTAPPQALDDSRALADYVALLDRWMTPAGGFIDFPAQPHAGEAIATPMAYHHKALFLTALLARLTGAPALMPRLRRLYDWLVHCWDGPGGLAGGLGRSSHALFGDACLLGALILLGETDTLPPPADDAQPPRAESPVKALCRRLQAQFRPDGLLWLDPAGPTQGAAAWDEYMHLSVYNAWFAAVLALCRTLGPLPAPLRQAHQLHWQGDAAGRFHDAWAGVLCLRNEDRSMVMIGTCGQAAQSFSQQQVELRYAGGVVLHARDHAGQLKAVPPLRVARTRLLDEPALAGATPLFLSNGVLYGLSRFEQVEVAPGKGASCEEAGAPCEVRLRGQPQALHRVAPSGLLARIWSALDWRVFGGRLGKRQALSPPTLRGVACQLTLHIDPVTLQVSRSLAFIDPSPKPPPSVRTEPVEAPGWRWLNPDARICLDSAPQPGWQCTPLPSSLPGGHGCYRLPRSDDSSAS